MEHWYQVVYQRPLSCVSVLICWIAVGVILVRLMPNKDARKTYHLVIMIQSLFDMLDSTSRPVCIVECTNYYIIMVPRLLRVLSWILTAVIAIFWLKIFIGKTWFIFYLFFGLLLCSLPTILTYFYLIISKPDMPSITALENIWLAWIKAISLSLCCIIVLICLVRVLRTDISTFATAVTFQGYKKVAYGLGLKSASILAVAISSAQDAFRITTSTENIPSWQYFFIDIYPGVNACITIWMVSRLLWKHDVTPVVRVSTGTNK